jgi:hypothetical protein
LRLKTQRIKSMEVTENATNVRPTL